MLILRVFTELLLRFALAVAHSLMSIGLHVQAPLKLADEDAITDCAVVRCLLVHALSQSLQLIKRLQRDGCVVDVTENGFFGWP